MNSAGACNLHMYLPVAGQVAALPPISSFPSARVVLQMGLVGWPIFRCSISKSQPPNTNHHCINS